MSRTVTFVVALACTIATAGCASWSVKTESSESAQSGEYRTYAWSGSVDDRLLDQRIRDSIASELGRRGIVPASDPARADFLVEYTLTEGPLVQTIVNPNVPTQYAASGPYYVPALPTAMTYTYTQGRLTLDFLDAHSGRVFWRGVAAFGADRPIEAATSKAAKAVGKMLRKYPTPALAAASRPTG